MAELLNLMVLIPQDERGIEPQSRDTLASTGVLWAECDKMVTLASDGIVSLSVQKAEDYHSLLKDAIEELEQWDPEEEDDESDTDSLSSHKQKTKKDTPSGGADLATSLEALSVTDLVKLQKRSLSTLRTVRLMYPALKKRRIARFPNITSATTLGHLPRPADIDKLDYMISSTQSFTEAADEIAGALYDGDEAQVSARLDGCVGKAKQCAKTATRNWKGEEDEFTGWVDKWLARLEQVGGEEQ